MKLSSVLFALTFSLIFLNASCSLKYNQTDNAEEKNPEFIFQGTKYSKYEKSRQVATVQAESMEKYKNSDAIYAKDVNFSTYGSNGQVENDGSCGLLYADTTKEVYEFFDGIQLYSGAFGASFSANVLHWNGKNQQLTSGRNDYVFIEKDDTSIYGSGFSASGVSGTFSFKNSVEGKIETQAVQDAQSTANSMGGEE